MFSDGRIFVINDLELLWFSPTGRLIARNGGLGDGPNEFRAIVGLNVLAGDTVVVIGQVPGSAKVFAPNGTLVRTSPARSRMPPLIAPLANGAWIGRQFGGERMPARVGVFREEWYLARYSAELAEQDTIVRLPGKALYGDRAGAVYVHATPDVYFAVGDRIAAGSSDRYEISVFDQSGVLRQIVRNAMPNPPVPPPPPRAPQTRISERGSGTRTLDPPLPAAAPAYSSLLFDTDGALWVRRSRPGDAPNEWHIYDRDGVLTASARLPAGFRPTEITRTHILGIQRADLDVETVRLIELVRQAPPAVLRQDASSRATVSR
jgi:hypothetical protein